MEKLSTHERSRERVGEGEIEARSEPGVVPQMVFDVYPGSRSKTDFTLRLQPEKRGEIKNFYH